MSANKKEIVFMYSPGAEFEYECLFRDMYVGNIEDVMNLISDYDFTIALKAHNDGKNKSYISGVSKSGVRLSGMTDVAKILAITSFPSIKKKLNILYLKYIEEKEQ